METNGQNPFGHNAFDLSGIGRPKETAHAVQLQVVVENPIRAVAAFQSSNGWAIPRAHDDGYVMLSPVDIEKIATRAAEIMVDKMVERMQASEPETWASDRENA